MNRIVRFVVERKVRAAVREWIEAAIGRPLTKKEKGMFTAIFGHWQTTLIGVAMGAAQLHQGGMTWQNAIIAALMATLGIVAKDANKSGGAPVTQ